MFAIDHLEEKGQLSLSCELDEGLSFRGRDATLPEFSKIEDTADLMSQPHQKSNFNGFFFCLHYDLKHHKYPCLSND